MLRTMLTIEKAPVELLQHGVCPMTQQVCVLVCAAGPCGPAPGGGEHHLTPPPALMVCWALPMRPAGQPCIEGHGQLLPAYTRQCIRAAGSN
jgi:hypothetical protein